MHEALRAIKEQSQRAGLFLDFDGTLSEIVEDPAGARPLEGVSGVLMELTRAYALVAIVSGRDANQLVEWLGPWVEIWGVHGAQRAVGGRVELTEEAKTHRELILEARGEAERRVAELGIEGALVEDKEVAFNLHFRASPNPSRAKQALDELSREIAQRFGLRRKEGRMSFELNPPSEFSKAGVVLERSLQEELSAVAFIGDDAVDLPAFDALDRLAERGLATVRVAVSSEEAPKELIERADVVVEGPAGVLKLLREFV